MSSFEELYKGYAPYFKEEKRLDEYTKEISLMPSTIETIDMALYKWLDEKMNVYTTTNTGWKKVPTIWVLPERAYQIKNRKELRDKNGIFELPVITLERSGLQKDPSMKGVAWANIPNINDAKGGAITVARTIQQDKTATFANRDSNNRTQGQVNSRFNNKKVVYQTMTMPMPTYVVANYELGLKSEYQQQMNEMLSPFITTTGQINNFFVEWEGHKFEGFLEGDYTLNNNVSNLGDEERKYESVLNIKVLGYLLGSGDNDSQPKITIRENAVEFKMPRERVIFGDKRPWENKK
tara:strand:+ start:1009 stop:1890 length:882 start_codon:yes stop_codon:yes gene_type:complete